MECQNDLLATSCDSHFGIRAVPKVVELGPLDLLLLPSLDEVLRENLQGEYERRVERNFPLNHLVEDDISVRAKRVRLGMTRGGDGRRRGGCVKKRMVPKLKRGSKSVVGDCSPTQFQSISPFSKILHPHTYSPDYYVCGNALVADGE